MGRRAEKHFSVRKRGGSLMPNKRKSNRELAITGSQLNEDEQILEPGEPDMPGDLGPCEKIVWTETVALLSEANRLTRLDALSLHAYSRSVCQWREAYAALKISGSIQRAGTGAEKMSAQLQVFNTADRTLERWTAQLGMSPKS